MRTFFYRALVEDADGKHAMVSNQIIGENPTIEDGMAKVFLVVTSGRAVFSRSGTCRGPYKIRAFEWHERGYGFSKEQSMRTEPAMDGRGATERALG